jgi:DNA-binding IclR family transcriptional regulator
MARSAPAQINQSLVNGLACLQELVLAEGPVGVRELGRRLGMDPTRVSRLLGTLGWLGLAVQDESRKYHPGPAVHVLSALSLHGSRLLTGALPVLRELAAETKLTVALGVLWRSHVCYLYHGRAQTPLEQALGARGPFPARQSSIGRVLLAHLPPGELEQLCAEEPELVPPEGPQALADLLSGVRTRGFARGGIQGESLAVAVGLPPIAALAVAGTIEPDQEVGLAERLREAALRIDDLNAR